MPVTPADAAELLSLAAAFDRRKIGEADAVAWADALHDLTPTECAEAIRLHYRETDAWLMPAHVRQRVRYLREVAADKRHDLELRREIEADKAYDAERAKEAFERLVAPIIARMTSVTVKAQKAEKRARGERCDYCKAQPGQPCVNNGRERDVAHPSRYDAIARADAHG